MGNGRPGPAASALARRAHGRAYHRGMVVVALLVSVGFMAAVSVVTRHPPLHPVPTFDVYLDRWSAVHEGYDARPTRVLRGWLTLMYAAARPLAQQGILPDVVTAWAVWLALAVVALAALGGPWAVLAAVLLVAVGVGDGLDGAVAVLTDRATRWGYVLDSVADRITDVLFLVAAWAAGAPAAVVVPTGVAVLLVEYVRARAGNAGFDHVAVITVGERPTRVICCAIALVLAGVLPDRAASLAGWSVAILLALSAVALAQLTVAVARALR